MPESAVAVELVAMFAIGWREQSASGVPRLHGKPSTKGWVVAFANEQHVAPTHLCSHVQGNRDQ
jgi:hypothetical protein